MTTSFLIAVALTPAAIAGGPPAHAPAVPDGYNTTVTFAGNTPTAVPTVQRLSATCSYTDFRSVDDGNDVASFPGGTFKVPLLVVVVGEDWSTWRPRINGKHLAFAFNSFERIDFSQTVHDVSVKAEPNDFRSHPVTMTAITATGRRIASMTRVIRGAGGAASVGLSLPGVKISAVVLSAPSDSVGFAFTNLRWGSDCGS